MIIFANQPKFFLLVHTVVYYGSGLGWEMASGCNRGLLRTQKWPKKDLKMNCFSCIQKLMKNNEIFFSQWPLLHSYRLSGVQGTDNCQKFNPGNKNRPCRGRNNDLKWPKLTKMLQNLKKIEYFSKSTQFSSLVHTVVSYGSGLGREMASGYNRGL